MRKFLSWFGLQPLADATPPRGEGRFEIYPRAAVAGGGWGWRHRAGNNEITFTGEGHTRAEDCERAIGQLHRFIGATVVHLGQPRSTGGGA